MVIFGHLIVMDSVNIGTLKAHLSEYLNKVRQGGSILVLDRKSAIARIVPLPQSPQAIISRKPSAKLADYPTPKKPVCARSSLEVLLEERQLNR